MFARIFKFVRSLAKEQKSLDKYYCVDNDLRSAVLITQSNNDGKNLENTVLTQLNRMGLPSDKISYYQGTSECGYVVQCNEDVAQLIQATWSMYEVDTCNMELKGLMEASMMMDSYNLIIITCAEEGIIESAGKQVRIVPSWK